MKEIKPNEFVDNENLSIPSKNRKIENLHIVFWLIKDLCWCLSFKPLAILMIFPTLFIAFIICIQNKKQIAELCHNLAVLFWIIANSIWMFSEFFKFDTKIMFAGVTGKSLAIFPFVIGILILTYYYGYFLNFRKQKIKE